MENKFAKILSATALVAGATLAAKLLGLVRDRILASTFGAGAELDTYYAAFRIPDFIFGVLVLGALFAAFIPIFTDFLVKKDEEKAYKLTNTLVNGVFLLSIIVSAILFVFAPDLMRLLTPGFTAENIEIAANMMRIMLASSIIFAISGIYISVLQSHKKFLIYSLSPMFYNAGIIFGATILVRYFGIYGLAWGVVTGALLQFFVQVPAMRRLGYRWQPVLNLKDPAVLKIFKLMIPRAASLALGQINMLVETIIASLLAAGSIAVLTLANNLQMVPVGILAIAFATVIFPTLAETKSLEHKQEFAENISFSMRQILFFVIPISVGIILLRAQIVRLALGAGNFGWENTAITAEVLGIYAISIFAQSLCPLLIRAFFAVQDTKTPFYVSIGSVILNTVLAIWLGHTLGVSGLALTFTITSILQAVILTYILRKKTGGIYMRKTLKSVLKFVVAAAVMGFVVYGTIYGIEPFVNTRTVLGLSIQLGGAVLAGALSYIGMCSIMSAPEVETIKGKWLRKIKIKNKES